MYWTTSYTLTWPNCVVLYFVHRRYDDDDPLHTFLRLIPTWLCNWKFQADSVGRRSIRRPEDATPFFDRHPLWKNVALEPMEPLQPTLIETSLREKSSSWGPSEEESLVIPAWVSVLFVSNNSSVSYSLFPFSFTIFWRKEVCEKNSSSK